MKYRDDRAHGIALLRQHARQRAQAGQIREAHLNLITAMEALLEEFRVEFDVPGVRYWHHPESESYFSTRPGEQLPSNCPDFELCIELARHEYLSRQSLHFGYDDRL